MLIFTCLFLSLNVMKNKIITILICILLFGCSKKTSPNKEKDVFFEKTLEWMEEEEIDNVCKRIKNLNLTFVAPGAGITNRSHYVMRGLMAKYNIKIPKSAMENKGIFYCADTEAKRLKYFEEAIYSKHDIIWAIRGGFGSNMIITDLNKMQIPQRRKILVGFSDTTSLNLFVTQKWGWRAVHAPVFIHLEKSVFSIENFDTLLDILEGKVRWYELDKVYPINNIAKKQGVVKAPLTGGNLTIVESSIGTCWEIQTDNKILFVEDINLNAWRIYRSLYHLQEAGKLKRLKAIVFGRFVNCGSQKEVGIFLSKISEFLNIPAYITDQFGHGNHNKPIVYDAIATLQSNKMKIDLCNLK